MLKKILTSSSQLEPVLYIIILMIQTKLFSDLYLAKILNTSTKLFFPCTKINNRKNKDTGYTI